MSETRGEQYAKAWALVDTMVRAARLLSDKPGRTPREEATAAVIAKSAVFAEHHIPAWTRPSEGVDDPPAACARKPDRLVDLVRHHYGEEIALAEAIIAEMGA